MKDIETREDIDELMKEFYHRALADEIIGYVFTDVMKLDLEKHLPVIGDFWDSLLLGAGTYHLHGRNPMQIHDNINKKTPLVYEHFERWLEIFYSTIDEMFAGEIADNAKMRARAIAHNIQRYI
jgi:hemoglobin